MLVKRGLRFGVLEDDDGDGVGGNEGEIPRVVNGNRVDGVVGEHNANNVRQPHAGEMDRGGRENQESWGRRGHTEQEDEVDRLIEEINGHKPMPAGVGGGVKVVAIGGDRREEARRRVALLRDNSRNIIVVNRGGILEGARVTEV